MMGEHAWDAREQDAQAEPAWARALEDLECSLHEAMRAVLLLRQGLMKGALPAQPPPNGDALPRPPATLREAIAVVAPPGAEVSERVVPSPEAGRFGSTAFDRLWDRIETERKQQDATPDSASADLRGLDLLPAQYLMTVEDREGKVDLVTLHRALASLAGMQDISLVSYANGVPVISIRASGEIDLDRLGAVVASTMDRQCEVIPQDNGKLYLRMKAEEV